MRRVMMLAAMVVSATVRAQATETEVREPNRIVKPNNVEVKFTGHEIDGDILKPTGTIVKVKQKTRFDSMVGLRTDFSAALRPSADNL